MNINCRFIAANTNPVYHCLSYFKQTPNMVVYCSSSQVYLHNTQTLRTSVGLNLNSLAVDPGRCNCLQTYQTEKEGCIIAGYEDGHIALFRCPRGKYEEYSQWQLVKTIKQQSSVITIEVLQRGQDMVVGTLSNKAVCKIYVVLPIYDVKEATSMAFPLSKIPQALCFIPMDKEKLLLALGGMDQQIHLYASDYESLKFEYLTSLKGHDNAITKLTSSVSKQVLLASSSKDGYIRMWKVVREKEVPSFQKSVYNLYNDISIFLESILIAHECSVTNICWATKLTSSDLTLVSVSMDCTVGVWQRDQTGVWLVKYRLGQLYGNKNAFFSLMLNEQLGYIMTANFTGASCVWEYIRSRDCFESRPSFSGHFNTVNGLAWNHTGDFLVSTSKDQTTRVYCENKATHTYNEISRAQIHGYDINTLALIPIGEKMIDLIACGADEKVIRVIEPPSSAANFLNCHTRANLHLYFESEEQQNKYLVGNKDWLEYQTSTQGGTQVLGLMTKAQRVEREKITNYYEKEDQQEQEVVQEQKPGQPGQPGQPTYDYSKVPTQDYLVKHTLWPEMNKLYGHPYEILSLAVGKGIMASSCHSLSKQSAFIIIWDLSTFKMLHQLYHHKNSVNDLCFSKDGKYLLAVSKDRTLSLYATDTFNLLFSYQAHVRAITACDISSDGKLMVTVSRDKTLKVHSLVQGKPLAELKFKQPLFAVKFKPDSHDISCGCEDGSVYFVTYNEKDGLAEVAKIPDYIGHSKLVSKICWTVKSGETLLATCSYDHSVRVYSVTTKIES